MKVSIGKKLFGSFFIISLLLVVISYFGVSTITKLESDNKEIVNVNLPLQMYIGRIKADQLDKIMSVRGYLLYKEPQQIAAFNAADQRMKKSLAVMAPLVKTPSSKKFLADFIQYGTAYDQVAQKIFTALQQGNPLLAEQSAQEGKKYVDQLEAIANQWDTQVEKLNQQVLQTATKQGNQRKTLTYEVAVLAILLSLALGFIISRAISKPIVQMAETAARITEGDLTVKSLEIKSSDEIGALAQTFNHMVDNLKLLIRQINNSAQQVTSTSEELTATSQQNSAGAQQISTSLQELATGNTRQTTLVNDIVQTVSYLNKSINHIAAGAQEQAQLVSFTSERANAAVEQVQNVVVATNDLKAAAEHNFEAAQNGDSAVHKSVEGLKRIQSAVLDSAHKISELGKQSQQIGEIIQVIDDIAEQTNLLALNAAIEAARAGEFGKGFAVVADEVRKLAERSGKATKEIANLITSIQLGTEVVVQSMELGTKDVELGVDISQEAQTALTNIISVVEQTTISAETIAQSVTQIAASIQEVSKAAESVAAITEENTAATEEMENGSEQVNQSIVNIAAIAQENAASAEEVSASTEEFNAATEEIAASAHELSTMAQELQNAIAKFQL